MNYNKKTRAELIKIAIEAEKTIRELYDTINSNNKVIVELQADMKKDQKYYDNRYSDHLKTVNIMKDKLTNLENRNFFQRILNKK